MVGVCTLVRCTNVALARLTTLLALRTAHKRGAVEVAHKKRYASRRQKAQVVFYGCVTASEVGMR
jgi:hypothetical protein